MRDSFQQDVEVEAEEDPVARALNGIQSGFASRSPSNDAAMRSGKHIDCKECVTVLAHVVIAKQFIRSLDCLPSIARYIYRSDSTAFGGLDDITRIRRRSRATSVISELSIIFRRAHDRSLQQQDHHTAA